MLKFIFIIFTCLLCIKSGSDQCQSFDGLTPDQIWVTIRPLNFQNYFIISFGFLSFICLILTILTWVFYKSFSVPSDIMFAICWCQLIQNGALVVSSFYFLLNPQSTLPKNFPAACTAVSILFTIGNTSSIIYNVVFCLVLSVSITKTLKGSLFSKVRYHALIIISVTVITLSLSLSQVTNSGFSGICGYKLQNRESFARFFGDMLIVGICVFSMIMFKSKIPKSTYFKKVSVFGFYYYYMGCFIVIQAISSTGYLVGNIACLLNSSAASNIILISTTFATCSSILLSYVLMGLRFAHPLLRMKIRKLFLRLRGKNDFDPDEDDLQDRPWLGSLIQSIRGSQIISFLSGILVCFAEHENKIIEQQNITNFSFKKNYLFKLNEDITDQYIIRRISDRQSLIIKHKLEGMRPMPYSVKFYCVQIFSSLLAQQTDVNIFHSFNINQNMGLVKQKSITDGGKSGQFFFGTYDNKFIIKTITEDEAMLYLQRIKQFYEYFKQNKNTMIAKILGLYKFVRTDVIQRSIYIILMRNVSPYKKEDQLRVYDIKGSQFNRSTLDQRKIDQQNDEKFRNHTLKDLDFRKLQQKIAIQPHTAKQLKKQLKKDADFLGKMQVMDYSILIIKRKGKNRDQNKNISYRFNEFPCYTSRDQYYNIGIIDYLQSWTLRKKAQRAFKTMITKKKVTVTSPEEYSKRLSQFVDEII